MLKFALKGQCLDFGLGWTTGEGSLGIEDNRPGAGVVNTVDVLDEAMKASGDGHGIELQSCWVMMVTTCKAYSCLHNSRHETFHFEKKKMSRELDISVNFA